LLDDVRDGETQDRIRQWRKKRKVVDALQTIEEEANEKVVEEHFLLPQQTAVAAAIIISSSKHLHEAIRAKWKVDPNHPEKSKQQAARRVNELRILYCFFVLFHKIGKCKSKDSNFKFI